MKCILIVILRLFLSAVCVKTATAVENSPMSEEGYYKTAFYFASDLLKKDGA